MRTEALRRRWAAPYGLKTGRDLDLFEIEALRERHAGKFTTQMGRRYQRHNGLWLHEHVADPETHANIVTNEGLNDILGVYLNADTQLTVWYVTGFTDNVTPIATHDYAAPGVTEITTADVAEAVRETYNANAPAGQSIDNVAGPVAQYIADQTFTMWGAMLVAGSSTFGDVTDDGVHILFASSLFGTSKAMVALDTIDITYTFTAADA